MPPNANGIAAGGRGQTKEAAAAPGRGDPDDDRRLPAAGPGALATVAAIAATCGLMWAVFRSAGWVSRWLGEEGLNVITRLTGFLLVCIGVQFVGSGIRSFMAGA